MCCLDPRDELSVIVDRRTHRSLVNTYTTPEQQTLFDIKTMQSLSLLDRGKGGAASRLRG
jgi:hypothetical protein